MTSLSPDLFYAAAAAAFTGVLWIPIIVNRLLEMGILPAVMNPRPDGRPAADWAWRMERAHSNAVENLVVFAPLAVIVHLAGLGDATTAAAGFAFLASRIAHAVIYVFGIPLLRTIAFLIGFAAQMTLAARILGA